jgi:hypothetical protein
MAGGLYWLRSILKEAFVLATKAPRDALRQREIACVRKASPTRYCSTHGFLLDAFCRWTVSMKSPTQLAGDIPDNLSINVGECLISAVSLKAALNLDLVLGFGQTRGQVDTNDPT